MTVPVLLTGGAAFDNLGIGGTQVSAAFSVGAGDTVVVCAGNALGSGATDGSQMTVADSLGNSYTQSAFDVRTNSYAHGQFYFFYPAAHVGITITITYTTRAINSRAWQVIRIPGTSATPLNQANHTNTGVTPWGGGSVTTTQNDTVVIESTCTVPQITQALTYPAGYTSFTEEEETTRGLRAAACWKELLTTATENPQFSFAAGQAAASVTAAYTIPSAALFIPKMAGIVVT